MLDVMMWVSASRKKELLAKLSGRRLRYEKLSFLSCVIPGDGIAVDPSKMDNVAVGSSKVGNFGSSKDVEVLDKHIEVQFMPTEDGYNREIFEEKRKLDDKVYCVLMT